MTEGAASEKPLSNPGGYPQASELCEYLEWDSEFFSCRIARCRVRHLSAHNIGAILRWCSNNQIDCLYFLASGDDSDSIRVAGQNSFALVDIRMTLDRSLADLPSRRGEVRIAQPRDYLDLKRITSNSFSTTRFYNDPHFPRSRCDDLYQAWIERSLRDCSQGVLVAGQAGEVAGYITCTLAPSLVGQIGLLAVDPTFQGSGHGKGLVVSSLHYFRDHGMSEALVVTQGNNVRAQRLYQGCGFLTRAVELWYHLWPLKSP